MTTTATTALLNVLLTQLQAADASLVLAGAIALFALAAALLEAAALATQKPTTLEPTKLHRPASTLPLLGNTLDAMFFQQHRFFDWLVDESIASGAKPWILSIVGRAPTYVVCTPDAFEDVFKTYAHVFEKGPDASAIFKDFLGDGIVAVDGHQWFLQRKTASQLFSMQMMRDVVEHVVMEKTLVVHAALRQCVERKQPIAIVDLFAKYSSDIFARVGFGVDLNCLAHPFTTTAEHAFIDAIESGARVMQQRFQQPMWLWRLQRFLNVGPERQAKKDMAILHDFVDSIILRSNPSKNDAAAKADTDSDDHTAGKDLLSLFLHDTEAPRDVGFLRDMVVNFFAAAKDTTTLNLSWFVLMMNRHPHVAAKVRAEIRTQLPALASGATAVPTMADVSKLVYLEAALRESMRLNNSMTSRCANADVTLSDGTFIPQHANVIASIYVSARMPSCWGNDAAEYKPERWIDPATGQLVRFSPFQDITFLAGPRKCIGMRFALLQMKTMLATLMSQFDVRTVEDPFQVSYEFSFILAIGSKLVSDVAVAPGGQSSAAPAW